MSHLPQLLLQYVEDLFLGVGREVETFGLRGAFEAREHRHRQVQAVGDCEKQLLLTGNIRFFVCEAISIKLGKFTQNNILKHFYSRIFLVQAIVYPKNRCHLQVTLGTSVTTITIQKFVIAVLFIGVTVCKYEYKRTRDLIQSR